MSDNHFNSYPSSHRYHLQYFSCRPAINSTAMVLHQPNCYARPAPDTMMAPQLQHAGLAPPRATLDTVMVPQRQQHYADVLRTRPIPAADTMVASQVQHTGQVRPSRRGENVPTEILLEIVSTRLKEVQKERFVMQQMAKIEACQNNLGSFEDIEKLEWYDYSGCPQKFTN